MGRMFGDKFVKEEKMVVKMTEEGITLSDLHLAAMILACVEGTACYKAIPRNEKNTRFLFCINGDPDKIKQFIDYWFTGNKGKINEVLKSRAEELRKYGNIISMLKALIDKSRSEVNMEGTQEPVSTETATNKGTK